MTEEIALDAWERVGVPVTYRKICPDCRGTRKITVQFVVEDGPDIPHTQECFKCDARFEKDRGYIYEVRYE